MKEVNFLPNEQKDRMFKRRKNIINYSSIIILVMNIALTSHIAYGICEINLKEKIASKAISQAFNNNNYTEKVDTLDFFEENIVGHFLYEGVNFKGSTLSLKIIIKDKNEFSKCVKDLEKIKKCSIEYLIAPYEENVVVKFEVGLEVKK